jgi:hypothetical protein
MELYFHSPIHLHGMVLNYALGQLYLYLTLVNLFLLEDYLSRTWRHWRFGGMCCVHFQGWKACCANKQLLLYFHFYSWGKTVPLYYGPKWAYCTILWWHKYWALLEWWVPAGRWSTLRKTCPSASLFTINIIWTSLDLNLGLHSDKPAANCLSYDMVLFAWLILWPWRWRQYICMASHSRRLYFSQSALWEH